MDKLILIGGHSGSGKSTLARRVDAIHKFESVHIEADYFFYDTDGNYDFDPEYLKEAHNECKLDVEFSMEIHIKHIIVANTFTQQWEVDPYLKMAKEYGYEVEFIRCTGEYQNVHDVPDHVIQRQKDRMENIQT